MVVKRACAEMEGGGAAQGFMDPHIHMLSGGLALTSPNLTTVASRHQFTSILREACGAFRTCLVATSWD